MSIEKVNRFRNRRSKYGGNFTKTTGVFFSFENGDNIVRFVGDFLETRTHFIAPSIKKKDRGLCIEEAFNGEGSLPKTINCLNWDIDKEDEKDESICPICAIHDIVNKVIKEEGDKLDKEEKEFLINLRRKTNATTTLKWNIIDRKSPFIFEVGEDGEQTRVMGYKVANVGMEAWEDINGIYRQISPTDPASVEDGVDLNVRKDFNGTRPCYSVQIVMQGTSAKKTPLTDEEREMKLHDLKRLAGKYPDIQKIIDGLHEDLREILEGSNYFDSTGEGKEESENEESENDESENDESENDESENDESENDESDDFGFDDEEKNEEQEIEEVKAKQEKIDDKIEEEINEWQCFGTCDDPENPECKTCESLEECIKERENRQKKLIKSAKKKV